MKSKSKQKEIIKKIQMIQHIIKPIFYTIIMAFLMYYLVTDENETIINILNSIKENNNALDFVLILSPIILIVLSCIEIGKYIVNEAQLKDNVTKK